MCGLTAETISANVCSAGKQGVCKEHTFSNLYYPMTHTNNSCWFLKECFTDHPTKSNFGKLHKLTVHLRTSFTTNNFGLYKIAL